MVSLVLLLLLAIGWARLAAGENNFRQLVAAGHWYAEEEQGRLMNQVHLNQMNSWVRGRGSVSRLEKESGVANPQFLVGERAFKTYRSMGDALTGKTSVLVQR